MYWEQNREYAYVCKTKRDSKSEGSLGRVQAFYPTRPDPTRPDPTRPDPTRPNPFRFFTLPLPSRFVLLTERLEQGRLFSQLYKPLQVSNEDMTRLFILSGVFLIVISTFLVQDTYHRDWNQISKRTGRKNKALFLFANATCARSISPISLDLKSTTAR